MARIRYRYKKSEYLLALQAELKPMARAAHAALKEAGQMAVQEGHQHLAAHGFAGRRWRGFRARIFPKKPSVSGSVTISHRLNFLGVFEHGGTITGNTLLWLPITANLPALKKRWTPRTFVSRFGKLAGARRGTATGRRLLFGTIRGKRVPVFVGVPTVKIGDRLNFRGIVEKIGDRLAELYFKHLQQQR